MHNRLRARQLSPAAAALAVFLTSCGRIGYEAVPESEIPAPFDGGGLDAAGLGRDGAIVDAEIADAEIGLDAGELDAGELDAGELDAGDAVLAAACRFGAPERVGVVASSGREQGPSISRDLLVLCFASDRTGGEGGFDIRCSGRFWSDQPWLPVGEHPINSSGDELDPALAPNGFEMIFASNRAGGAGGFDLYHAGREFDSFVFLPPTRITALSTPDDEAGPEIAPDGKTLYFTRRPVGGGPTRLYVTRRIGTTLDFEAPVEIAELSSAHHDTEPAISDDQQTLVWCSDRPAPGRPARSHNVWCAGRSGATWGPAVFVPMTALAAPDPCSPELGSDGSLYFTSAALPGASAVDVFRAPAL